MSKKLDELLEKAKSKEELWANCTHEFKPDGESEIVPGTVRSFVCTVCGLRVQVLSREQKIRELVRHIERSLPNADIAEIDDSTEPACPPGFTFIFPKGAIMWDGPIRTEMDWPNSRFLVNLPNLSFALPEMVFRINPDGWVEGLGEFGSAFADKLNGLIIDEEASTDE